MINKDLNYVSYSIARTQKGATLFTALVFLALMTIVSVSAAKISMLDVLVSGNNQQEMILFQKTARDIDNHTKPEVLLEFVIPDNGIGNGEDHTTTWNYDYDVDPGNPNTTKSLKNRVIEYGCGAIGGLATSQGPDNTCRLFDFEVRTRKPFTSARDRHVRGAGKEYPSPSRNNYNN